MKKVGSENADQRDRQERLGEQPGRMQRRVHTHRNTGEEREQRRDEAQLQRGRQALRDQLGHRSVDGVGDPEPALRQIAHVAAELDDDRVVQPELLPQFGAFLQRGLLPDHLRHGVADIAEQRESDQRDRQHDDDRLQQPAKDERDHGAASLDTALARLLGMRRRRSTFSFTLSSREAAYRRTRSPYLIRTCRHANWLSGRCATVTPSRTPQASAC